MVKEDDKILLTQENGINRDLLWVTYDPISTIYILKDIDRIKSDSLNFRMFETLFGKCEFEQYCATKFFALLKESIQSGNDSADLSQLFHTNLFSETKKFSAKEVRRILKSLFKVEQENQYQVFLTLI
jgi:hypothetical protein